MKTKINIRLVWLLSIVFLLSTVFSSVYAEGTATTSDIQANTYYQMFGNAINSDGVYAEQASFNIGEAFKKDPSSFITKLNNMNEKEIDVISGMLIYYYSYSDISELKETLEHLKNNDKSFTKYEKVIKSILKQISVIENSNHLSQENLKNPEITIGFNIDRIKGFIQNNESQVDEEYSITLANACLADPNLFVKLLSEIESKKIENICRLVAKVLKNQGVNSISEKANGVKVNNHQRSIFDIINKEIKKVDTSNIIPLKSVVNPELSFNTIFLNNKIKAGEKTNYKVELISNKLFTRDVNYFVELYSQKDEKSFLKECKYVKIPAGQDRISFDFNPTFYNSGTYNLSAKVYDSTRSTLIFDSKSFATITAVYDWEIYVWLYQHRTTHNNRDDNGVVLQLWGADGTLALTINDVLGRSVSGDSPLVYKGNTPTGDYSGYLAGPCTPSTSYGPYKVVAMTGVSGQIIDSGRSGIWIHGGSPETDTSKLWYPLRPTYGCVRITNNDQYTLQTEIEAAIAAGSSNTGSIKIREWPY